MSKLTYLLADPDLLHADVTFFSFDLLDSEPGLVKFGETLLDYSELTTTKLAASAEVELNLELRLTPEAEQLAADINQADALAETDNEHLGYEPALDLVVNSCKSS